MSHCKVEILRLPWILAKLLQIYCAKFFKSLAASWNSVDWISFHLAKIRSGRAGPGTVYGQDMVANKTLWLIHTWQHFVKCKNNRINSFFESVMSESWYLICSIVNCLLIVFPNIVLLFSVAKLLIMTQAVLGFYSCWYFKLGW